MTADVRREITLRRPETGWSKARRRRASAVRTCVPATADGDARQARTGADWNIVRGDD